MHVDIYMVREKAKKDFQEMVAKFLRQRRKHRKLLAREFGIGKSTVDRWASGVNAPQPIMRTPVIRFISEHQCACVK